MTFWAIYKGTTRYTFPGTYILQGGVMAVNDDFKFEWEQEKGERYWRRKFSGKLIFKDDASFTSYTTLKAIYDSSERCDNLVIAYIKEGCVSAPDYNIYFKGFLNYINWEIDEDKRTITIKEIDPFDEYSIIKENMKTEFNILFAGERVEAWAYIDTHYSEADKFIPDGIEITLVYNDHFFIQDHLSNHAAFNPYLGGIQVWGEWLDFYGGIKIWARDVKYFARVGGDCPSDANMENYGWIYVGVQTIDGKEYCKWIRWGEGYDIEGDPWEATYMYMDTTLTYNTVKGMPEIPLIGSEWTLIYDASYDQIETYSPVNIWYAPGTEFFQKYSENRYVKDVIEYILSEIGFTGGYLSEFLDNTDDPMFFQEFLEITNRRNKLLISQKSDVRLDATYISYAHEGRPDIDAATKGMLSLEKLLEMLGIFNVHWYIDDTGRFRIEHEKYFYNGLSYNGMIINFNGDLSSNPHALYKKKYAFDKTELSSIEKFKFMEAQNLDFVGVPVTYSSKCLNLENNDIIEYVFDNLTTDLKFIYEDVEAISRDGFCFFIYLDMNSQPVIASETGMLTGNIIINGHLSWANLHHYYWTYDRNDDQGIMNSIIYSFNSIKMTKIQTDITIMDCCTWDFDPYKWFITELGNGKVEKAVEDNKTGTMKLTLKYYA